MGDLRRYWLPSVDVARSYRRAWLRDDLVAGIVLTALLIPAGIGYAEVSGLPPVTGLYATIVPLLVYAVVGPSRILVLGPDSSLAPIIGASILPLAAGDPDRAVALAGLLSILMGVFLLIGGIFRLGFVTDLLSKPIRIGYLNGIALVVIIDQVPKLLGFSVDADGAVDGAIEAVRGIGDGQIEPRAAAIGILSLVGIIVLKRVRSRVPGVLLAVIVSGVVVAAMGWRDELPVVGSLPQGLPAPALGGLTFDDVTSLLGPALGIAVIAFADTGVLSRVFAARRGENVSGSQEMRAIGLSNIASGAMGGFAVSASSSRTPVAEQAGSKSQLTGVVGAIAIICFIVLGPDLTSYLPSATLAAVVITAASSLVDLPTLVRLARVHPVEAVLSVSATAGVVLIGVLEGIVITIGLSFLAFVNHSWRPYRAELGRIPNVRGYHDLSRNPDGHRIDGIAIVRFDAPLFFANGGMFDDYVRSVVRERRDVEHLILAAEPITDIDATAVDELIELDDYLNAHGIEFIIAEMKGPVRDRLLQYGLADRFGPDRFAPTTGAAVDAILGRQRDDIGRPSDRL